MKSMVGNHPPQAHMRPPHEPPPPCQALPFQLKDESIWPEELELLAATVAAATGNAPLLVTTNSQAIASKGGAGHGGGSSSPYGGPKTSYGCRTVTSCRPGGTRMSTWATQKFPRELIDTEHRADSGGAFPLGGSISPSTATPEVCGRHLSSRWPEAATTSSMAVLSSGEGHGAVTATRRTWSGFPSHSGVIRSGPFQRAGSLSRPRLLVAPGRSLAGIGGGIPGRAWRGSLVS